MLDQYNSRRTFLLGAASGAATLTAPAWASAVIPRLARLPLQQVPTAMLDVGYHAAGPESGRPVVLIHDFGYDIHSYEQVARLLAAAGLYVLVPHLRGHGSTRFKDEAALRSGQQAALGEDMIAFLDALHIPEAVFAGIGWGARAACAAAILRPSRCVGVVAINGLPMDNPASATLPEPAANEAHAWLDYYLQTERGRLGLQANRRDIARVQWQRNAPAWRFDEALFARACDSFDNADYVDVLIHAHRKRFGNAAGDPRYDEPERKIALLPKVAVPSITLESGAAGPHSAASPGAGFRGPHRHHLIGGAGHDLAQEAPQAVAAAVAELVRGGTWRT